MPSLVPDPKLAQSRRSARGAGAAATRIKEFTQALEDFVVPMKMQRDVAEAVEKKADDRFAAKAIGARSVECVIVALSADVASNAEAKRNLALLAAFAMDEQQALHVLTSRFLAHAVRVLDHVGVWRLDNNLHLKGVSKCGSKYQARFYVHQEQLFVGRFGSARAAAVEYDRCALTYFGFETCIESGKLNFPHAWEYVRDGEGKRIVPDTGEVMPFLDFNRKGEYVKTRMKHLASNTRAYQNFPADFEVEHVRRERGGIETVSPPCVKRQRKAAEKKEPPKKKRGHPESQPKPTPIFVVERALENRTADEEVFAGSGPPSPLRSAPMPCADVELDGSADLWDWVFESEVGLGAL